MASVGNWAYVALCVVFAVSSVFQFLGNLTAASWEYDGWGGFLITFGILVVIYMGGSFLLLGNVAGGYEVIYTTIVSYIFDLRELPPTSIFLQMIVFDFGASVALLCAIWVTETASDGYVSSSGFEQGLPFAIYLFIGGVFITFFAFLVKVLTT